MRKIYKQDNSNLDYKLVKVTDRPKAELELAKVIKEDIEIRNIE